MRACGSQRRRGGIIIVFAMSASMSGIRPAVATGKLASTVRPAISSGRLHSCGLSHDGTVVCWGDNSFGELGNNSVVGSTVPVKVHGLGNNGVLSGVTAITTGNGFSCALLAAKAVDCWGYGGDGELGFGSTGRSLVPVKVHGVGNHGVLTDVTAITAGNGFACALLRTRAVVCWGANGKGQLGNHSTARSLAPAQVHGAGDHGLLHDVVAISAGSGRTPCALLATKTVVCWGYNGDGELGNNSTVRSSVPVSVHGISNVGTLGGVAAISGAGLDSSCAVLADGTAACWGYNGSLGINSAPGRSLTPVRVHGERDVGLLSGVAAISDHSDTPCALLTGGTVDCWGHNSGDKLGDSHTHDGSGLVPVQVHSVAEAGSLSGVAAISGGELWSCALLSTGAVNCWGYNTNGELGNSSTVDSARPVAVHGVKNVGLLSL